MQWKENRRSTSDIIVHLINSTHMKRRNITLSTAIFGVAILACAFTLPRKAERPSSLLYWYEVSYNDQHPAGAVLSSGDFWVQGTKAGVIAPCPSGFSRDCLRGFTYQLTLFPNTTRGDDQITKP